MFTVNMDFHGRVERMSAKSGFLFFRGVALIDSTIKKKWKAGVSLISCESRDLHTDKGCDVTSVNRALWLLYCISVICKPKFRKQMKRFITLKKSVRLLQCFIIESIYCYKSPKIPYYNHFKNFYLTF